EARHERSGDPRRSRRRRLRSGRVDRPGGGGAGAGRGRLPGHDAQDGRARHRTDGAAGLSRRTEGGKAMRARRVLGILAAVAGAIWLVGPVPGAGAQETPTTVPQYGTRPVNIALEVRTDYPDTLPSPLYVPLRARLTDAETGQPLADP